MASPTINSSPLTKPKNIRPIFVANSNGIKVYGDSEITQVAEVELQYIKKPAKVEWAYQMVFGEALYNANESVDFELHPSEETELIVKILEMAGLLVKDLSLYQVFNAEEQEAIQQEKS